MECRPATGWDIHSTVTVAQYRAMESPAQDEDPQRSVLQQRAIEEARLAYSHLPHGDAVFRQCVEGKETLLEVLSTVEQKCQSQKKKKSTRFLSKLQKYTTWLQNMSAVVDIVVQTQAGFGCPLWAPIKFILKISDDHSKATEQVFNLLQSITESLPRLEVYEKLQSDNILQIALLNIFTDVVDFSVRAFQFFRRGTLVRLAQTVVRSFDRDIGAVIARLERHARVADQTAVATELLEAAKFRKEAGRRQHEELEIQCERWLKPSDVKHVHLHQVRARLDGTCDWITSNDVFGRWIKPGCLTSQDRLLVISGTHGCGKSVLASSIVARLEESEQHTLFFAFSSSDGSRQTSESLIRTLLWQLLQQTTNKENMSTIHHLRLDGQPTIPELWEAFGQIASSLAKPVYCVVDGIDECTDYNHTMSVKIMQIMEVCPNLRILLLGRPHVIETHSDNSAFAAIEITSAMLYQDIEVFINNEIAKSDILSLPEFRTNVYKTLTDKSDGMFLWVRLMVDDLRKSSSKSEFSERLQNLPRGLEKAYQLFFLHLFQKLDKYELRLAHNVLAFTSASCRPLRFEELRYAHAMHCRSLETVAQPLEEYLLLQPPQRVLDVTGGLVSMTDGVLRLIHSSVRDFLIRPEDQWVCEPDRAVLGFRIDITQTHRSFAWLCLDYMRLEQDERRNWEPETCQSTQALWDSYPLLAYATLYACFHLNRSWPPCSISLAKIETVLESTQSILWVQHFAHLLFEDVTLESQMDELMVWGDRMADAGLDKRLFAIFEETLKERIGQMRRAGKHDDPLTESLQFHLNQATVGQFGSFGQQQNHESADSVLESGTAGPNVETSSPYSSPSSNDPSATLSRAMDLLKGQNSLPIGHQIELCLRLSTSLRRTRVLIDPLKVLFQLILRNASGIHVFALLAIGEFYKRLEKYQEALEVYTAASRKMDHLDVPLKFRIHSYMGDCYRALSLDMEALRSYERAFSGQEILLGSRHYGTLKTLKMMMLINDWNSQYTEVLRLSDKIFMQQEFVPELNLIDNLQLHNLRHNAYLKMGNHDRAAHVEKSLQATLKLCRESYSNDDGISPRLLRERSFAYYNLGNYDKALESFQLACEAFKKSKGSNFSHTLFIQASIALTYARLGRYYEAKKLLEMVHAKQQSVLGPDHREVWWTRNKLEALKFVDNELGEGRVGR